MKQKSIRFLSILVFAVGLYACGSLQKNVFNTYPSNKEGKVELFVDSQKPPQNAEVLALLSIQDDRLPLTLSPVDTVVVDTVLNVNLTPDQIDWQQTSGSLDQLISETRALGGNALWIYQRSDGVPFSVNNSMIGMSLHLSDTTDLGTKVNTGSVIAILRKQMERYYALPIYTLGVNVGFGTALARTKKAPQEIKNAENKVASGYDVGVSFCIYPNPYVGVGINYDHYSSVNQATIRVGDQLQTFKNQSFDYIGPYLSARTGSDKFVFTTNVGVGYYGGYYKVGYRPYTAQPSRDSDLSLSGGTFGLYLGMIFDYRITRSFALGADISLYSGLLGKITIKDKLNSAEAELPDGEKLGLGKLSVGLAARYYFGERPGFRR